MRQHELEADQHRGGERGELEGASAAARTRAARRRRAAPRAPAARGAGRARPRRGTGPSPRSRTATRGRAGSRTSARRTRAPRAAGRARAAGRERGERRRRRSRARSGARAAREPFGYASQSGASSSAANFVQPASATAAPRAHGEEASQKPQIRNAGMIASFVFEFETYSVNGYAAQANASVAARRVPAEATADEREPEHAERVEEERRRVRGPELVPLAGPAEDGVAGQVRDVRDRPVGVAARVRGLAAAVRLDPLADLALGVGRPARPQLAPAPACARTASRRSRSGGRRSRPRSRRRSRSARLDVEPDPEAGEEDAAAGEQPHRPERRATRAAAGRAADPEAAAEQVGERRVGERGAPEDLALVEEAQRDREREQREQVEVPERERAPQVGEPDEEDARRSASQTRRC